MRNFLLVVLNLASVAFVVVFLLAMANYLFGSKLSIKGAIIPGDPVAAIAFLVIAVMCGGIGVLVNRRAMRSREINGRIEDAG